MRILLDTNVLLDYLQHRKGFDAAEQILQECVQYKMDGFVAAHSIIFFILRKVYTEDERRDILASLTSFLSVAEINHEMIASALARKEFSDFEDCLQDECASIVGADFIVSQNIKDYVNSRVPAVSPKDFLQIYSG
jgi:predicted nucleic-acid-binding protein